MGEPSDGTASGVDRLRLGDPAARPTLERLVRGIHRTSGIREWVTLESSPLMPVAVRHDDGWGILALIAAPSGSPATYKAWGAITWSWPDGRPRQLIDLRRAGPTVATCRAQPAWSLPDPATRTRLENELFGALEAILADPAAMPEHLTGLAEGYARILPEAVYPLYWELAPSTVAWLTRPAGRPTPAEALAPVESRTTGSLADLTPELLDWLRRAAELARRSGSPQAPGHFEGLRGQLALPGFRLAVVGEFSRGKSTLLNRLLGRPLLPEGSLPTTRAVTSILAGDEERLEISTADAPNRVLPLDEATWEGLLAPDAFGAGGPVEAGLRIFIDHDWLRTLDIELIDTPGAGDLGEATAARVYEVLGLCDAALMVLSSTLPLSLTERAFLEQQVLGRDIPRVLVVVSKLDLVAPGERTECFRAIAQRVGQVRRDIAVLPAHAVGPADSDAAALGQVRVQIERLAAQDDRRNWRDRKVAAQLVRQLDALGRYLAERIEAAQLGREERRRKLHEFDREERQLLLKWSEIGLELDARRLRAYEGLRGRLDAIRGELLEQARYRLARTLDPLGWWRQDLPYWWRAELARAAKQAEAGLLETIARDFAWLDSALADQLALRPAGHALPRFETPRRSEPTSAEGYGVQQLRLFTRLGTGAAVLAGYILVGPLASAVGVFAGVVGDKLMGNMVEEQRARLNAQLEPELERAFDAYFQEFGGRLRELYQRAQAEAETLLREALASRRSALEVDPDPAGPSRHGAIIADVEALGRRIVSHLEGHR